MIDNNIIQSLGAGSGIDSKNLVKQLVEIERSAPQERIDSKIELKETQISDFGKIKSALSTFQSAVEALTSDEGLFSKSASFTESNALVPTELGTGVEAGTYKFEVQGLAQSQSLASTTFNSEDEAVGEGTLTFEFGAWDTGITTYTANAEKASVDITIDSSNNTLKGLRDEINKADMGVKASIVNNGSGYVLLLTAESGANNELKITAAEAGGTPSNEDDSGLSRFAFNEATEVAAGADRMQKKQAGADATLIVNGLEVTRSTNQIDDVVEGLTLDLLKESPGEIITVTVTDDVAFAKQTTRDFVDAYNALLEELEPIIGYDAELEDYGSLANDALAKSVVGQMRNLFASSVTGLPSDATFSALANLGIRTELDGTLSINDKDFNSAFDNNLEAVQALLTKNTQSSDSGMTIASFGKQTAAGEYDVVITQNPTKGLFTGTATAGFPLDTTGKNFGINLTVNGVASDLITIPADKTYTSGLEMAEAIQAAINSDQKFIDANTSVTVTFDTDHFVITSSKYGSSSKVVVSSATGDAITDLGLAAGTGTVGKDVAGTIDGVAGFGLGQVLRPKLGEPAEGLNIVINETSGGGKVNVSRGVAGDLNALIDNFLENRGLIDNREDVLGREIDNLDGEQDRLDRRMTAYEERLMQQFIAMENILNGLNNSGSFLDNLFKTLPFTSSKD